MVCEHRRVGSIERKNEYWWLGNIDDEISLTNIKLNIDSQSSGKVFFYSKIQISIRKQSLENKLCIVVHIRIRLSHLHPKQTLLIAYFLQFRVYDFFLF